MRFGVTFLGRVPRRHSTARLIALVVMKGLFVKTRLILTMLGAASFAACGSSNNSNDSASDSKSAANSNSAMYSSASASSVGVLMTDAPANLAALASVNVSLAKVQIHVVPKGSSGGAFDPNRVDSSDDLTGVDGANQSPNTAFITDPNDTSIDDDAYWQTITMNNSNFNLLALQGNVTAVVGGLDLTTGVLTQIRLFIDPNGTNDVVLSDASICPLDVSSVVAKGFKVDDQFPHTPLHNGNSTNFTVDFDLKNSLSQDGNCAFSLHPIFHLRSHDVQHRPDGGWAGQHPQDFDSQGNVRGSGQGSAFAGNGNATIQASGSASVSSSGSANRSASGSGGVHALSVPEPRTKQPR